MSGIGISVHLKAKLPVVTVVEAVGPRADLQLTRALVQPPSPGDLALTLRELLAALRTLYTTEAPGAVVIRSINLIGGTPTVRRTHHQVEGVLLAVSRETVSRVEAMDNQAIARTCRGTWAETLASVARFQTDPDASAAALAALVLAGEA
jgi:hypothetical protein